MEVLSIIRAILGSAFVLFVPGLIWTYVFFAKKEIDWIERIALSFGLSIALVPLSVFYLNKVFGVKINFLNSFLIILALCVIGLCLYWIKEKYSDILLNARKSLKSLFHR